MPIDEEFTDAMHLRPSARLQTFLGKELIADPNLAILEFVKNSYDAGADHVRVSFQITSTPTRLTIADNGVGMNEEEFRFNWLRPGFSQKAAEYQGDAPPTSATAEARERAESRTPAGEKGLGRLSAGRLGEVMTVWTRPSPSVDWLKVTFDWRTFANMYEAMDQVPIPFEFVASAPSEAFEAGTVVEIEGLSQLWQGKVPGRPARGRPRTRLGRLKQDLSFLVRTRGGSGSDFKLELDSDHVTEVNDIGVVTSESSRIETAQYAYRFSIEADDDSNEDGLLVSVRSIREVVRTVDGESTSELLDIGTDTIPASQWPGAFSGLFLYTPPPAGQRALEINLAPSGVLLYRDNILVEPYGMPGNDWLGVEARKASRQGHAAIQPSTFSGEVAIQRTVNPALVDMSNRMGLLENEESLAFVDLVRREFDVFEELVYDEVLRENWVGKDVKAAKQAAAVEQATQVRLKALAHRAGQPLQALGFEVVSLEALAENERIPADLQGLILEQSATINRHVQRLGEIVRRIQAVPNLTSAEVDMTTVIDEVMADAATTAAANGVALTVSMDTAEVAFVPRELAAEVVQEVVTNAIEATGQSGGGTVEIVLIRDAPTHVDILVKDDGKGFGDQAPLTDDFDKLRSTKGRPAGGLVTAYNAAVVMRGSLTVRSTSANGTTILLRLPTGSGSIGPVGS